MIATAIAVGMVWRPVANAQGPERKQEVTIPGTNLSLKGGWRVLFHQGCRFAVPVSWHADTEGTLATAPDGSNILVGVFRINSWSAHKAQIKAAFGHVNVMHEDNDRRLWFEIGDKPRVQHYVDVLNGPTVCSAILETRMIATSDADDTIKRIIDSVGPVAAGRP